jgi:hypothetical protein
MVEEGRRYLDGSGGASAVNNIGHGRARIAEVMARQARMVAFTPSFCFTSAPIEELADLVAALTPGDLNNSWFVSGGSEATENAVKLAHQHFMELGRPTKHIVISRAGRASTAPRWPHSATGATPFGAAATSRCTRTNRTSRPRTRTGARTRAVADCTARAT